MNVDRKCLSCFGFYFFLIGILLGSLTYVSEALASPQDKERWNRKYHTDAYLFGKEPIAFLRENIGLLPKGYALDVAMGEGRNGVFLATQGHDVMGIDISEEGLKKATALGTVHGVTIQTQVADLEHYKIPTHTYDVILCTYYLQRNLFPQIKAGLKPGGMAIVETYTLDHLQYRPSFPQEYLLQANELLDLFSGFIVLRYQVIDDGQSAYASILVQKPR